jgi:hypothetical protein
VREWRRSLNEVDHPMLAIVSASVRVIDQARLQGFLELICRRAACVIGLY